MMPVVAHTTARCGLRPVAKAFGTSESAMATLGFGMSASAHSRSIMACSSGASCGDTSLPPMENSATRSLKNHCATRNPATRITARKRLSPR